MYILGDIGNSETKVFLVNKKDKILKNFYFPTNKINCFLYSESPDINPNSYFVSL